jgi:hypothetical protein
MKVDFTRPLTNYKGELLTDGRNQNVFAKDVVCSALSSILEATKEDKLMLDNLSGRVWHNSEATELSPEEAALIRKNIEHLPAGIFSQLYHMLG